MRNYIRGIARLCAAAFVMTFILTGCTKTIYIPLESSRRDSVNIERTDYQTRISALIDEYRREAIKKDSVVIRDSVVIVVNASGDVMQKQSYHYRDRDRRNDVIVDRLRAEYDSIVQAQRQEFNAVIEELRAVPVPVEKPLGWWEKLKRRVGGVVLNLVSIFAVVAVIWLLKHFRR